MLKAAAELAKRATWRDDGAGVVRSHGLLSATEHMETQKAFGVAVLLDEVRVAAMSPLRI